jgi:hypothetical protein
MAVFGARSGDKLERCPNAHKHGMECQKGGWVVNSAREAIDTENAKSLVIVEKIRCGGERSKPENLGHCLFCLLEIRNSSVRAEIFSGVRLQKTARMRVDSE